jgi:hypothetical protein
MLVSSLAISLILAVAPVASEDAAPVERTHTIVGDAVRLDLEKRSVGVKVSKPRREYDVIIDPEKTRIVSLGRELRLEDVPLGARVYVVCADGPEARHVAQLLRIGDPPTSSR